MDVRWWQRGILYQVYPRSFADTDGDGVGDLPGVISRLDYLEWLGVDALWLSPIYPSPMKDFGYDVADYIGVDPLFGTIEDFDRLIAEAHARGLKVVLDFVPNHTSDQHPWFRESRAARNSARRDWYLWRNPAPGGGPPNNWLSCFGGPAWQFDEATGQYYYHAFLREQPDLNWRNPAVVQAMLEVLRFWLERGVDGFRVDALWHLVKDERFADNPPDPAWRQGMDPYHALVPLHTTDRSEVHALVAQMRRLIDRYPERVLIGEIYLPLERLVGYYGADLEGAHLPFNFHLLSAPWEARYLAHLIDEYEDLLPTGAWPNWVLGNHDKPRIASRVGPAQARVAAMLLLTLRGTPTLYYGDEIGMANVSIPPERVQDPLERNVPGLRLDAVERCAARRLRQRRAVAAARRRLGQRECRRAARGRTLDARALSKHHRAAPPRAGARGRALPAPARRRRRACLHPCRASQRAELPRRAESGLPPPTPRGGARRNRSALHASRPRERARRPRPRAASRRRTDREACVWRLTTTGSRTPSSTA
jgi:alpha-glucosidase